jgi:hypothetical protein
MWSSPAEDPELPSELPPLDPDPGDGELDTAIDLTDFVDTFEAEADVELDDDEALDLDVGVAVDEPEADTNADERAELVLDIAELLAFEDDEPAQDDALGPEDFEPSADVEELEETGTDPDETAEPDYEGLVSEELPSLDADEAGDFSPEEDWMPPEHALDQPLPPSAARQWATRTLLEDEIDVLVAERGLVVAAGATIHCFGRDTRSIAARARVTSATLVGGVLVYFTSSGELVRQELWQPSSECLESWREPAGTREGAAVALELGGGGLEPGVVLARTSTGRLLRSRDRGTSFSAEALHARVLALDARAHPAISLVETGSGRSLLVATEGGSAWRAVPLDAPGAAIARGEAPLLASHGELVALADAELGIAVSADAGQHFVRVAYGGLVTALAAGAIEGEPRLFAALYRETEDRSYVIALDAQGAAEVVAQIGSARAEDGVEASRVAALAWDGGARRLLAAGAFGLVELVP